MPYHRQSQPRTARPAHDLAGDDDTERTPRRSSAPVTAAESALVRGCSSNRGFLTFPPGTASFDPERHGGLALHRRKTDVGGPSYQRRMARCTAPVQGHRTSSGAAACPVHGGKVRLLRTVLVAALFTRRFTSRRAAGAERQPFARFPTRVGHGGGLDGSDCHQDRRTGPRLGDLAAVGRERSDPSSDRAITNVAVRARG
jgi:hypothetical protein